jgi:hypothetical protein
MQKDCCRQEKSRRILKRRWQCCWHRRLSIFKCQNFCQQRTWEWTCPGGPSCKTCKECQFRTSAISLFKEDQEYQVILDGLKFDEERKKWTASYPFCIPPSELQDNYHQVKSYTENMERRIVKQNRVEEFNAQLKDTVDRGVFRELQLKSWTVGKDLSTTLPWSKPSRTGRMPPAPCRYA